jgi:O-antigen/teichoic acid export membrane protein
MAPNPGMRQESPFVSTDLARRAGGALIWRGLALGGEKIIFLLRLLVLARLLSPEDFGVVAIGMIALAMALSLTNFGVVDSLIQQPAADRRHLDTAWTISLLRGIGITTVLFVAAPWIAEGFGDARATGIVRALALTALFQAAASIEVARLNRELRFRGLAGIRLSGAIANTIVAVLLARNLGPWALVWGAIAGAVTHLVVSYLVAPYRPAFSLSEQATSRIASFGRWIFLIGITAMATDAALRWIIANRLGVLELGLFFMAARLAFLPGQLISELVGEVSFPVYAQLQENPKKAAAAFRGLLVSVAALLLPACLVFAWLVPGIVQYVLGERWEGAVVVMQLLILGSIVGLLGDGVTPALKAAGRPSSVLVMDLLQLVLMVAMGWPLIGAFGLPGAGLAWVGSILSSQLLAAAYARRLFGSPFEGLGWPLLAVVTSALLATAAAALVVAILPGAIGVGAAILCSIAAAGAVTLFLDRQFDLGILQTVSGPFPWLQRLAGSRQAAN